MRTLGDLNLTDLDMEWTHSCEPNACPIEFGGFAEIHLIHRKSDEQIFVLKTPKEDVIRALEADPEGHRVFRVSWRKEELVPTLLSDVEGALIPVQAGRGPRPYIVIEYMPLGDMRKLRGQVGLTFWLELSQRILSTLAQCHERGVWHLDLKPANLFLTDDLQVKIGDWGLSKIYPALTQSFESSLNAGTFHYMPPEQHQGRTSVGPCSDIYSAGLLLAELLLNAHPIAGRGPLAVIDITSPANTVIPSFGNTPKEILAHFAITLMTQKSVSIRSIPAAQFANMFYHTTVDSPSACTSTQAEQLISHFVSMGKAGDATTLRTDIALPHWMFYMPQLAVLLSSASPGGGGGQFNQLAKTLQNYGLPTATNNKNPVLDWLVMKGLRQSQPSSVTKPKTRFLSELQQGWSGSKHVLTNHKDDAIGTIVKATNGSFAESDWAFPVPIGCSELSSVRVLANFFSTGESEEPNKLKVYLIGRSTEGEKFIGWSPSYDKRGIGVQDKVEWGFPLSVTADKWDWYELDIKAAINELGLPEESTPTVISGIRFRGNWALKAIEWQ